MGRSFRAVRGWTVNRRRFVQSAGVAGLALLAGCGRWPGQAQPPTRMHRLGLLALGTAATMAQRHDTFLQELQELGYTEGRNLLVERRYAPGDDDQLKTTIAELVRLPVDVLVVPSAANAQIARDVTDTIPIVVVGFGALLTSGLVDSLGRPGGNVTGITSPTTLNGKRVELLKQAIPSITRVGVFQDASRPFNTAEYDYAGHVLGVQVMPVSLGSVDDFKDVFEAAVRNRLDALVSSSTPLLSDNMARLADLMRQHRLPSCWDRGEFVLAGCLMSYGANSLALWHRAAYYVDRILKGTIPADLPIEQPMRFDFVINLRTAQALGLTIPQHVLLQATEVIQ
jgi:putative tryptophan/tyrosine transport system substrate-binding protein